MRFFILRLGCGQFCPLSNLNVIHHSDVQSFSKAVSVNSALSHNNSREVWSWRLLSLMSDSGAKPCLLMCRGAIFVGSGVAKGAGWLWKSGKSGVDSLKGSSGPAK